jgi:regulator of sigma E protease
MQVLVMIGQLLLGLSILVALHEFGHYITARWFGMRVNKFYLFFDFLFPLPHVLNFALWKKKIGDTEYGLGWFPLGGYVDIAGMIDESKDASQLASTPQPWEFRSKPAWQRLVVMLGGIIVNVILGVLIFFGLNLKNGHDYLAAKDIKGIAALELGKKIGLQTGDNILAINGNPLISYDQIPESLFESNVYYSIERKGKKMNIEIPNNMLDQLSDKNKAGKFIAPLMPFKVDSLEPNLPAAKAGLMKGDSILSIGTQRISYYHELQEALSNAKNKTLAFGIMRGNDSLKLNITVNEEGRIGFYHQSLLKKSHLDYSFGQALQAGANEAFGVITNQLRAFGKIFRREISASKSLGSFITIGKVYGGFWDWDHFWSMTAMLSMVLAFMNLLPIPALDGGHAVILIYEIISGRKPSDRFLEITQQIGMVILLSLMVFAIGNDVFRNFFQ